MTDDVSRQASRRRQRRRGPRTLGAARWPALVLIVALLVAAGLAGDSEATHTEQVDATTDPRTLGPAIASADSLGAFWFCAGGTGAAGGAADHTIAIVNTTDEERLVDVTVYGSRPEGGERPTPVPVRTTAKPYDRSELRLGDFVAAEFVSATVEIDGGGVLVEHRITGPNGTDRSSCSSVASDHWTVPVGATDTTAPSATSRELLVFFNPFPADAVLDVRFSTDAGERGTPETFRGFVVPGRGVVGVDLASAGVTVSTEIAAEVTTRAGRVVVDRIQIYAEPAAGRAGVALSTGAPAGAPAWVFPAGGVGPARREVLVVANSGELPAEVDVEVRPASDDVSPEPFELTVQPDRHVLLDLAAEERMAELLAEGGAYSLVVRTADGTEVSAERLVWSTPGAPGGGVSSSTGSAVAGVRLSADMTGADAGSALVLFNPSTETVARVELAVVGEGQRRAPTGAASVDVGPGETRWIPIEQLGSGEVVVIVESTAPIVAERDLVEGVERSVATAVPDAATVSVLDLELFADFAG